LLCIPERIGNFISFASLQKLNKAPYPNSANSYAPFMHASSMYM